MNSHRVGIIGVGAIAKMHARAIADLPDVELVAACCRTEQKGREFCEEHGGDWFPRAEELLDRSRPDVVTICTPSGAHLDPTLAALGRGVHVWCEKPIEVSLERARQMVVAERASSARLGGVFPQRFSPVVAAAHEAAAAGRLGALAVASAHVPWWRDDEYYAPPRWQGTERLDGGGALINQSIHALDAMLWIAEAAGAGPAVEAFGYTGRLAHDASLIEVEDAAVGAVRFRSGAVGMILGSTAMWPGGAMRFHLGGRDGTIEIQEKEIVTWAFRDERPGDAELRKRYAKAAGAGGASDPLAIDASNHTRNLADFLASIDEDRPSIVDAAEAWKALAVVRAVYEAAETGRPTLVQEL